MLVYCIAMYYLLYHLSHKSIFPFRFYLTPLIPVPYCYLRSSISRSLFTSFSLFTFLVRILSSLRIFRMASLSLGSMSSSPSSSLLGSLPLAPGRVPCSSASIPSLYTSSSDFISSLICLLISAFISFMISFSSSLSTSIPSSTKEN